MFPMPTYRFCCNSFHSFLGKSAAVYHDMGQRRVYFASRINLFHHFNTHFIMKKLLIIFSLVLAALAMVSCGSDKEDEPNFPNKTMTAGETYTIPGKNGVWTSDNQLIASVSNGIVKAERVGQTTIRNGSKSFKVTVNGKYNTFKEPCLQWGASKSTVKSFMSGYTLQSEDNESIFYKGKYREALTGYMFKSSGLYVSTVMLLTSSVSTDELAAFLNERYVYVTQNSSEYYFAYATPDEKNVVLLQLTTINSQVVYMVSYGSVSTSSYAPAAARAMMKVDSQSPPEVKSSFTDMMSTMKMHLGK